MSGNNSRGEKTGMGKSKTHFRAKVLSQTTVLEGRTFRAFKCPLFIEGWPTPSGVAQIGLRPGQDLLKRLVSLGSANSNLRFSKILAVLSDLDWWVAGVCWCPRRGTGYREMSP